jgi:hypothetical protein
VLRGVPALAGVVLRQARLQVGGVADVVPVRFVDGPEDVTEVPPFATATIALSN